MLNIMSLDHVQLQASVTVVYLHSFHCFYNYLFLYILVYIYAIYLFIYVLVYIYAICLISTIIYNFIYARRLLLLARLIICQDVLFDE